MFLYRIVQNKARTNDLSGTGAFRSGGRWNSKGTYMLYTSQNSSLAFLESLVHFEVDNIPTNLYIMELEVDETAPIYSLPEGKYPADWLQVGLFANRTLGDDLMNAKKYFGIKIKSAINTFEYNFLLNPLFPGYHDLIKIGAVTEIMLDPRLLPPTP